MNRVMLMGRLSADPVIDAAGGVELLVSTVESYLDANDIRRERASYHRALLAQPLAKLALELPRGALVFVEGVLRGSAVIVAAVLWMEGVSGRRGAPAPDDGWDEGFDGEDDPDQECLLCGGVGRYDPTCRAFGGG